MANKIVETAVSLKFFDVYKLLTLSLYSQSIEKVAHKRNQKANKLGSHKQEYPNNTLVNSQILFNIVALKKF